MSTPLEDRTIEIATKILEEAARTTGGLTAVRLSEHLDYAIGAGRESGRADVLPELRAIGYGAAATILRMRWDGTIGDGKPVEDRSGEVPPDGFDADGKPTWQGEPHPPPKTSGCSEPSGSNPVPTSEGANSLADRVPGESAPFGDRPAEVPAKDVVPPGLAARFWARIDRSAGENGHWLHSYPGERVHVTAHRALEPRRVVWLLQHGFVPPTEQHIEVTCGEPKCVNPKHLICPTFAERFWARVLKAAPDECWLWIGQTTRGYGRCKVDPSNRAPGRLRTAISHRTAYELHHGVLLSPEQFVCHRCDNPPCCNPAHLWAGTAKDNHDDMVRKGRMSTGEKHSAVMREVRRREREAKTGSET